MEADIFVPFVFFAFLGAVIIVPILAKERTRRSAHELISQALARGQQLDPAMIAQMGEDMLNEGNRARKSLGNAVILLALAGGIVGAAYAADGPHLDGGWFAPAIILGAVGAAFLVLAIFDYMTKKRST